MDERELTDAEFWELQYHKVLDENQALQGTVYVLQEQLSKAQQELLRFAKGARETKARALFTRLGMTDNDAVVIDRDGKKLIVIQDETSKDTPNA